MCYSDSDSTLKCTQSVQSEVNFDQSWQVLRSAISQIHTKNASELSFEELYRTAYNLVLRKNGKQLYESVRQLLEQHLVTVRDSLVKCDDLLRRVRIEWDDHLLCTKMISDVLMYLDKVYAKEQRLPLIYDMGLTLWKEVVVKQCDLEVAMLGEITKSRDGSVVDLGLLGELVKMMESLSEGNESYFTAVFEPLLNVDTCDYYKRVTITSSNITQIPQMLFSEEERCKFLPLSSQKELISTSNKVLISSHLGEILAPLYTWTSSMDLESLKLVYSLVVRTGEVEVLGRELINCLLADGKQIKVEESKKNLKWIEDVVSLKTKYNDIIKIMDNDKDIEAAADSGMADFVNTQPKASEFLSQYIDNCIKSDSSELDKCIEVFRYIKDKDVFEKFYKQHLAKRLLQQKSDIDLEKLMISKIKSETGSAFTSKLEGMFRDVSMSKELTTRFTADKSMSLGFEISVLNPTFWPFQSQKQAEVQLPQALTEIKQDFEKFYQKVHSGRYLTWSHTLGTVDIRFRFTKKIHELNMPTFAAMIFLLFEHNDQLTVEQIEEKTGIPLNELKRQLQSIAVAPRTRILTKTPMSKEINPGDTFTINMGFAAPMTKIKVLAISQKHDTERKSIMESVEETRKHEIDAAIVRMMKSKKTCSHNELISETIKQLIDRFKPTPPYIKKRIEVLIEREYLQRDPDDRTMYHYLA